MSLIQFGNTCLPKMIAEGRKLPGPALCSVGDIEVPAKIKKHQFVHEALATTAMLAAKHDEYGVVGTANTIEAELYGWRANVGRHVDCTGLVYFMPIVLPKSSRVYTDDGHVWTPPGRAPYKRLKLGRVFRLNDYYFHWTRDTGPVVCLFAGSFEEPANDHVIGLFREGLQKLATGDRTAPRVSDGFRTMFSWECFALADGGGERMPIKEARRRKLIIVQCSLCDKKAVRLDSRFPYFWNNNRCDKHLKGAAKAKR
jgi:hypothetical protein